jgi:hypothetical protein
MTSISRWHADAGDHGRFREVALAGRVLAIPAVATSADIVDVVENARRMPWLPVVIECPQPPRAEITLARMLMPRATPARSGASALPSDLLGIIRNRPVGASQIQAYLADRCADPQTSALLSSAVGERPWRAVRLCRTAYYQAFRRLRTVSLADWRMAFTLAPYAGLGESTERVALRLGRDPRTVRSAIARLTGAASRVFCDTPGWEWFVEAVLRHSRVPLKPCPGPATEHVAPARSHAISLFAHGVSRVSDCVAGHGPMD